MSHLILFIPAATIICACKLCKTLISNLSHSDFSINLEDIFLIPEYILLCNGITTTNKGIIINISSLRNMYLMIEYMSGWIDEWIDE